MLSFYGRRLVKGTKESDLHSSFKSPFFLTDKNVKEFLGSSFFLKKKKKFRDWIWNWRKCYLPILKS